MKKDYKGMATTIGAIIVLLLILIFAFVRSENKFEGTVIGTTNNADGKLEFIYVEDEDEIMKFIFDETEAGANWCVYLFRISPNFQWGIL